MFGLPLTKRVASIGDGYGFPTRLYPVPEVSSVNEMVPLFGTPVKTPPHI